MTRNQPITIARLLTVARAEFAAVTTLAQTSRPGCKAARAALKAAAKHGLDAKPYVVVRQGGYCTLVGWEGGRVSPLKCVRERAAA